MQKRDDGYLIEKTVAVNRVCKVVKGGKRFGFAALVVVGDGKGKVGFASAKAREVPEAMKKATELAKRRMVRIPLRDRHTIYHDVIGHFGSGYVKIRSAVPGTGIIAGGPARAVFEALGVADVVAKSVGSSNPHNMVKAILKGLKSTHSPSSVAERRNKSVREVLGRPKQNEDKDNENKTSAGKA